MKRSALLASAILPLLAPALLANGGGYFRGGVESVGDIAGFEPKGTENIRILDEKLTVRLGSKSADVEVRYLMRNETAKKAKIRFGFPVEESFDRDLMGAEQKSAEQGNALRYCSGYQITAAGKPVKAKWTPEPKPVTDRRFDGVAGWLVSDLTFAANEEKSVLIRFQSAYPSEEWGVSDDATLSAARFKYRLSTAACWTGTIGEGTITLIPEGIPTDELRVIKPVNRFKKEGASWVWRFQDLEPTLADDFEAEAVPDIRSYPVSFDVPDGETSSRYVDRGGKWTIEHSSYAVRASSTLAPEGSPSYGAENVRDWGYEGKFTAWSEGTPGPGRGEWLELTPKVAKPLRFIMIQPGMWKSPELFLANARPKRILVELNGSHRFRVDVPDRMEEFMIPVSDFSKPVSKIRLTFDEVWPGMKYEDLCVTCIRLHARLDKKPKITPAR